MIILYILLAILLLLVLLLCCPVTVCAAYEDSKAPPTTQPPDADSATSETEKILSQLLSDARQTVAASQKADKQFILNIKYLFFNFKIFPLNPKESEEEQIIPSPKEAKPLKEKKVKKKNSSTFAEKLDAIFDIIKKAFKSARLPLRIIKHSFLIHHLHIKIVVAKEDAKDTALSYSRICAGTGILLSMLDSLVRKRDSKIEVLSNFCGDSAESDFSAHAQIRLIPIGFVSAVIVFCVLFLISLAKKSACLINKKIKNKKI